MNTTIRCYTGWQAPSYEVPQPQAARPLSHYYYPSSTQTVPCWYWRLWEVTHSTKKQTTDRGKKHKLHVSLDTRISSVVLALSLVICDPESHAPLLHGTNVQRCLSHQAESGTPQTGKCGMAGSMFGSIWNLGGENSQKTGSSSWNYYRILRNTCRGWSEIFKTNVHWFYGAYDKATWFVLQVAW